MGCAVAPDTRLVQWKGSSDEEAFICCLMETRDRLEEVINAVILEEDLHQDTLRNAQVDIYALVVLLLSAEVEARKGL